MLMIDRSIFGDSEGDCRCDSGMFGCRGDVVSVVQHCHVEVCEA